MARLGPWRGVHASAAVGACRRGKNPPPPGVLSVLPGLPMVLVRSLLTCVSQPNQGWAQYILGGRSPVIQGGPLINSTPPLVAAQEGVICYGIAGAYGDRCCPASGTGIVVGVVGLGRLVEAVAAEPLVEGSSRVGLVFRCLFWVWRRVQIELLGSLVWQSGPLWNGALAPAS